MWHTLASRVYGCIAATLLMGLAASIVATVALWRTNDALDRVVGEFLPSVIAAEEVEIALLEQRGSVSSFLLSQGDPVWLDDLRDRQENFRRWLKRAKDSVNSDQERQVLAALNRIAEQYDARRQDVVDLYQDGDSEQARRVLLGEVNDLYRQAFRECEALIEINQKFMDDASRRAVKTVEWGSMGMAAAIAIQLGLSGILLRVFYRNVLMPLRQMAVDLQDFAPARGVMRESLGDEMQIVGRYLQLVLTDAADVRNSLETQRKQLLDAQKLASVGKLAASVAHEIRNPLTAVKMWLFSARESIGARTEVAAKLDSAFQEVRRLEAIIKQFLEFTRPPQLKPDWTLVDDLVSSSRSLVEPLLRERGIECKQELSGDLPRLHVDRQQLIQVLVNLLRNAAEALPSGGQIKIRAGRKTNSEGVPEALLQIQDNGVGIPLELQDLVCEPFFTTKDDGTGLGLSIVASIVSRNGGRMDIESAGTGSGTTMSLHFPLPLTPE